MGDPVSCVRMPKSRYDFSNVSMNRAMNFSALMPGFGLKKCALTLPALPVRREWLACEKLAL